MGSVDEFLRFGFTLKSSRSSKYLSSCLLDPFLQNNVPDGIYKTRGSGVTIPRAFHLNKPIALVVTEKPSGIPQEATESGLETVAVKHPISRVLDRKKR